MDYLILFVSLASISISVCVLVERYHREQGRRIAAGAPKDFKAVMMGRGFYKDEFGQWYNG